MSLLFIFLLTTIFVHSIISPYLPSTLSNLSQSSLIHSSNDLFGFFFLFTRPFSNFPSKVFNFIPSISAITGISPNIYFWRISIALHVGPRFIIAICYKSYYEHMLRHITDVAVHSKGTLYMKLAFWLHCIEITSLCGVTYISNRENYSKPIYQFYQ